MSNLKIDLAIIDGCSFLVQQIFPHFYHVYSFCIPFWIWWNKYRVQRNMRFALSKNLMSTYCNDSLQQSEVCSNDHSELFWVATLENPPGSTEHETGILNKFVFWMRLVELKMNQSKFSSFICHIQDFYILKRSWCFTIFCIVKFLLSPSIFSFLLMLILSFAICESTPVFSKYSPWK